MSTRILSRLVATAFVWGTLVAAGDAPADGVALGGPEVYKLDWNTRSMVAADVDGDGRNDLILLNNARAKIDILYQRTPGQARRVQQRASRRRWEPVLEDARFRRDSVVTGLQMYALAAGDLDGDGLTDLAFTGKPDGLTVLFQGPEGEWERRRVFESEEPNQWRSSLAIVDPAGDGGRELVMLAENDLLVFRADARGELTSPERYPLADPGCYGLLLADLDEDGRPDVSYLAPNDPYPWRVRFRHAAALGPERAFAIPPMRRGLEPLRLEGRNVLAAVQDQTGLIEFLALRRGENTDGTPPSMSPRVYSTPTKDNTAESYALADLDGDGREDLAVGDRKGAQVWVYSRAQDGSFEQPVAFPSVSDLRSLSAGDVDGDGRAELFAVSRGERTVGISRLSPEGRLDYPEPLPVQGRPLAAATIDVDGDGHVELACVVEDEGRALVLLRPSAEGFRESARLALEGLRTDPTGITAQDVDGDGREDLIVFVPQSPARILLQTDEGFEEVSAADGFRRGLIDGLEAVTLSAGGTDGDDRAGMIVADRGYARSMRVDETGALVVLDQFNSLDRDALIAAAIPVDLDGDGAVELLLVHAGGEKVELLRRGRKGVFRHARTFSVGRIDLVDTHVAGASGELLLFGTDRFWSIPLDGADLEPRSLGVHESALPDVQYTELAFADFDGDGTPEMVALDTRETRVLEVLVHEGDGWRSELDFTVFDADPHYEGRRGATNEPREMMVADLTDDGRPDIVLLVHDRLLIYPAR